MLLLILAVVVSLAAASIGGNSDDDRMILALVNEDAGKYGRMLAEYLASEDYLKTYIMAKDEAFLSLKRGRSEAVLIIRDNYSSSLTTGVFENTLDLFSAPASGAGITVSEPAINKTIEFWMAEFARLEAAAFLQAQSEQFTEQELQLLKQMHERILSENPSLQVAAEFLDQEDDSGGIVNIGVNGNDDRISAVSQPLAVADKYSGCIISGTIDHIC